MTRVRKFSGKTVDEATETALAELGVELEDVDVRVIRPGRSGILGFGGEPAEIEVSPLTDDDPAFADDDFDDDEIAADAPREEADDRSGRGGGRRETTDGAERESRGSRGPRARGGTRGRGARSRGRGRGRGRARNGRGQGQESPPGRAEAKADAESVEKSDRPDQYDEREPSRTAETRDSAPPVPREKDEEAEQLVSELLDYFLGAMGVVADTYIRDDDEDGSMVFEIEGQDAGLLIGRRGETLQALQFLVRMVTSRQLGRKAYVVIDIEDYRERRIQMLRRLARRTAGRVASSGREDSLEPMSPAERRIVHMSLAGHPDVRTESEGEGNQRRVVIFPID
ncbi:MAG: Jag N-terminal domain-containing protein [Chloroflexi bacterium]|nr:Jag N-terminal domain-containing protein [Chloroflexota bacterium]